MKTNVISTDCLRLSSSSSFSIPGWFKLSLFELLTLSIPAQATIWDGLLSYWTFDEGIGTTVTDVVRGKDGKLVNYSGSPWTAGKIGSALTFNGTSQYVQVVNPDLPLGSSARTIAGWVKLNALSGTMMVYGQRIFQQLDAMAYVPTQQLRFASHGNDLVASITPSIGTGTWNFFALTYTGSIVTLYVNGSSIGAKSIPLNTTSNTSGLLFGAHHDDPGNSTGRFDYLSGSLDEWGVWNRALDPSEISAIYNGGTGLNPIAEQSYADWINRPAYNTPTALTPVQKLRTADPDGDGINNLEEFAFGLNPVSGASANPITDCGALKASGRFTYTRQNRTGLRYSVWTSTDLLNWVQDSGATEGTIITEGEIQTVPVTLSSPPTVGTLFVKVRAE